MPEAVLDEGATDIATPSSERDTSWIDAIPAAGPGVEPQPKDEAAPVPDTDDLDPSKDSPKETTKPVATATDKREVPGEEDEDGLKQFVKKPKPVEPPKDEEAKKSPTDALTLPKGTSPPKWFRGIYDSTKAEAEKARQEAEALRKEVADLKLRPASPEAETKWKTELESIRKEKADLEENLRITSYEKSPDFDREHIKPLEKAWNDTLEELADQEIEVDGSPKKTTTEDVQAVVMTSNRMQAAQKAHLLFGTTGAAAVMQAREQIRNLQAKRDEALETWRTKGSEFQKRTAEENNQVTAIAYDTFDKRLAKYQESYPEIFTLKEKDDEERKAFDIGEKFNQIAFKGAIPKLKLDGTPKTRAEIVREVSDYQGHVAARSRQFGVMVLRNNALNTQVEELTAKLKRYETSEPTVGGKGEGEGHKAPKASSRPAWEAAIDNWKE